MPFTVAFCVKSFTSPVSSGDNIEIYSNINPTTPIISNIKLSAVTGNQCPYALIVPDGTTNLTVKNLSQSDCTTTTTFDSNNRCATCNFSLTSTPSTGIGTIGSGFLTTANCTELTDYTIDWVGPSPSTNVAFTSGVGTISGFLYDTQQPFTNRLITPGTYTPKIKAVKISGATFTSSSYRNSITANLDCLTNQVVVSPLNCSNGTVGGNYSHTFSYISTNNGASANISTEFNLSSNTKYFAYQFEPKPLPDRLKITFSGTSPLYDNTPIVLEDIIGGNGTASWNLAPTTIPKMFKNNFFAKVLCLTGLTINNGDKLTIEIFANQLVNVTEWNLSLKCLNTFQCGDCAYAYKDSPYKILLSSVTAGTANLIAGATCTGITPSFYVSGCNTSQIQTNEFIYYSPKDVISIYCDSIFNGFSNLRKLETEVMSNIINNNSCNFSNILNYSFACASNTNNITYTKTSGGPLVITFSNNADFNQYLTEINSVYATANNVSPVYRRISTNNTQIGYYNRMTMYWFYNNNPNQTLCDVEGHNVQYFYFLPGATTITNNGVDTITVTLSLASVSQSLIDMYGGTCTSCLGYLESLVNTHNNIRNSGFTSRTTKLKSSNYKTISAMDGVETGVTKTFPTSVRRDGYYNMPVTYCGAMYPYSGTNILIPSLSSVTCNTQFNLSETNNKRTIWYYAYDVRLLPNNTDFEIWGKPITNYALGNYEKALTYSNGSVTYFNPYYVINS